MPGGFLKKKTIKMSPELARMIQEQLAAFKERFGREAGPEDPVFFDPDADTPSLSQKKNSDASLYMPPSKPGWTLNSFWRQ